MFNKKERLNFSTFGTWNRNDDNMTILIKDKNKETGR